MASIYLCGTPEAHCNGGKIASNAFLRQHVNKAHGSRSEAFRCYTKYLKSVLNYEQVGPREFRTPNGIMVLTKKSRFGGRLRTGKLQERWMPKEKGRSGIVYG